MRIVCQNCGAGYDIPDSAIPTAGREVQCAACSHAWYQLPAAAGAASGLDRLNAAMARGQGGGDAEPGHDDAAGQAPPRRRIDPEVLRVLTEEAETEARARAADAAKRSTGRPAARSATGDRQARDGADQAASGGPVRDGDVAAPPDPALAVGKASGAAAADRSDAGRDWRPDRQTGPDAAGAPLVSEAAEDLSAPHATGDPDEPDVANDPAGHTGHAGGREAADAAAGTPPTGDTADGDPAPAARAAETPPPAQQQGPRLRDGPAPLLVKDAGPSNAWGTDNPRTLPVMVTDAEIAEARARTHRKGFRRGFFAVLVPVCLAIAAYLAAPLVAERLPALAPWADAVLTQGDRAQAALIDGLRLMVARIQDMV